MAKRCCLLIIALLLSGRPLSAAEPVEIIVDGAEGDALANIRAALTLPYGLVQNNVVNELWIERFSKQAPDRVRRALEPFGYYHAEVHTSLMKVDANRYRLFVNVLRGEPVRIVEVTAVLEGPGAAEPLLKSWIDRFPLRKGDPLLQKKYEETKASLKSTAVNLGYLDAEFPVHDIRVDLEQLTARIDLRLKTGPRYRFGDVRFEGAGKYPEGFLFRFIAFHRGDIFSYSKLGETQLNLINSDRFSEVILIPEKNEARDDHVPVLITVKEKPTKRLRPGIGYATDTGPRFSLNYRDLDAFERGQEFHSELSLSHRLKNIGAGYIFPAARDINSFSAIRAYIVREDLSTHVIQSETLEVDRTRSLGKGRQGTVYTRLIREDSSVADVGTLSRLLMPGARFSERRYDSLIRPVKGHSFSLDLHGTHEALGSDTHFVQLATEGHLLAPVAGRLSVLARVTAGVTLQNAAFAELPASLRFFAGGDRSVRGYAYQSLGPANEAGAVTGGRNLLAASVELDQGFSQNWATAVFYDAGNAFNSFSSFDLFSGAGIGLRYYTAVGAIRIDIARQLRVENPKYRLHITMGVEF